MHVTALQYSLTMGKAVLPECQRHTVAYNKTRMMIRLSEFKQAAGHVEALRKLRRLRQAYGNGDSPPQRAVIELDCDHRPEAVILSTSARSMLNKALEHEEATITAELRSMGVEIDVDGPL
jgi:hypothetical protein